MSFVRLITCGVLLAATAAQADQVKTPTPAPPSPDADTLFEEGKALARAGRYAEACDRFAKSLALERTIGTELNLADCHKHLGHFREAWGLFIVAAGESETSDDPNRTATAGKVRDMATALEPMMTTMIVKVAQPSLPGLVITISGRATQPVAEIHEHADPGSIDVIATAPGLPSFKKTEVGAAGATVVVDIPVLDKSVPIEQPRHDKFVMGDRDPGRVHLAYGFVAAGGAAAVTSIAFTLVGRSHYNQTADGPNCDHVTGGVICNDVGKADIKAAQHLADYYGTGFAIGSAVLLGAAAVVYLTAPRTLIAVTPTATAQSVGLVVGGRF